MESRGYAVEAMRPKYNMLLQVIEINGMLTEEQINHYIHLLGHHQWELRHTGIIHLVALGTSIIPRIMTILQQNPTSDNRQAASCVRILGKLRVMSALDMLMELSAHEDSSIREAVALALADIGDDRAIPTLINLIKNDSWSDVREAAASALGNFPNPDTFQVLLEALEDEDDFVREAAGDTLAFRMGDLTSQYEKNGLEHTSEIVQKELQWVLGTLNDTQLNERLWSGFREKSLWMRLSRVNNLWNLCQSEHIPGLKLALLDSEPSIRLTAVLALQCIGTSEARAVLESVKMDEDAFIRYVVNQTLEGKTSKL